MLELLWLYYFSCRNENENRRYPSFTIHKILSYKEEKYMFSVPNTVCSIKIQLLVE